MRRNRQIHPRQISRRTILTSAAVMAASPALAEGCQVGPPPHQKGPLIWMDLDQVELDAAYDQAFYAPLRDQIAKRRASNS
jgi:arylformamidase